MFSETWKKLAKDNRTAAGELSKGPDLEADGKLIEGWERADRLEAHLSIITQRMNDIWAKYLHLAFSIYRESVVHGGKVKDVKDCFSKGCSG